VATKKTRKPRGPFLKTEKTWHVSLWARIQLWRKQKVYKKAWPTLMGGWQLGETTIFVGRKRNIPKIPLLHQQFTFIFSFM